MEKVLRKWELWGMDREVQNAKEVKAFRMQTFLLKGFLERHKAGIIDNVTHKKKLEGEVANVC